MISIGLITFLTASETVGYPLWESILKEGAQLSVTVFDFVSDPSSPLGCVTVIREQDAVAIDLIPEVPIAAVAPPAPILPQSVANLAFA